MIILHHHCKRFKTAFLLPTSNRKDAITLLKKMADVLLKDIFIEEVDIKKG